MVSSKCGVAVVEPAAVPQRAGGGGGLPLASLNHISVVCRSLQSSLRFYRDVLGFVPIRRPGSFGFDGAWLFNYGIGIHLLQAEDPESMPPKKTEINHKDNHISFQCASMEAVQRRLKELGIRYVQRRVEEGGIYVDQLFFHDPDGFMVEVCTCDKLPIVPLVPEGGHAAAAGAGLQETTCTGRRSQTSACTAAAAEGRLCRRGRGERYYPRFLRNEVHVGRSDEFSPRDQEIDRPAGTGVLKIHEEFRCLLFPSVIRRP